MLSDTTHAHWTRLAGFVATHLGLDYPPDRYPDLQRCFVGALAEFGCADAAAGIDWLLGAGGNAERLQVLAAHLTIGETYFFRERATLDALTQTVLPALIAARRGRGQTLRVWSAACCSGEEAYTLAILLHRLLPDIADWRIEITGTDLNADFLKKALAARYGAWSFRDAPDWLQPRYFERGADGRYTVIRAIRRMVRFELLNLIEGEGPYRLRGLQGLDLILCRNVLMYFTPQQMRRVADRVASALTPGGWLAVSPSEASHSLFPGLCSSSFPGAILFNKPSAVQAAGLAALPAGAAAAERAQVMRGSVGWAADLPVGAAVGGEVASTASGSVDVAGASAAGAAAASPAGARPSRSPANAATAAPLPLAADEPGAPAGGEDEAPALAERARALADAGRSAEALACCTRWLAVDKLDPAAHYLQAVVLLECGSPDDLLLARRSLQRAVFLDPDFVMAQVALGRLASGRGEHAAAARHRAIARGLLARLPAEALLPGSNGLSAARLADTLAAMDAVPAS